VARDPEDLPRDDRALVPSQGRTVVGPCDSRADTEVVVIENPHLRALDVDERWRDRDAGYHRATA